MYSVSSYFIQSSFLHSVSHTMREDIVPQVLSCSRFRNNQTELRKRQIPKYKNTENRILHSNKNIVKNRNMENPIRISYFKLHSGI